MLPRKGSRRVTIDTAIYRWRESHGHEGFELRMEAFEDRGQLLTVRFAYLHMDPAHPDHVFRPIMTNRVLGDVVRRGLARGWTPAVEAPGLELSSEDAAAIVSEYDYRHSKWIVKSGERDV